MIKDLEEIKKGLAQARAALNLLEKFIAEYETRIVNILPHEEIAFYKAEDDAIIEGPGVGQLATLGEAIHDTARAVASK